MTRGWVASGMARPGGLALLFMVSLGLTGESRGQQQGKIDPILDPSRQVFGADTEVVVLDLVVRDKRGRTVQDLRQEDIEILEDGAPQEVVGFRLRALSGASPSAVGSPASPEAADAVEGQRPAPEEPGAPRHVNLVTLIFDQLGVEGRQMARKAATDLVDLADRPDMLISVFQIQEGLKLLQQFTEDRDLLKNAILEATGETETTFTNATELLEDATRRALADQEKLDSASAVTSFEAGAAMAASVRRTALDQMTVDALRMTQNLQREQQGHVSLYSLLSLSRSQRRLAGRKTILYFSEGLQVPPSLEHVLKTAISEANRANVSVYAVDTRGLLDQRPLRSSRETLLEAALTSQQQQLSRGMRPVTREEVHIADTALAAIRMDQQGALADLAEETGGLLIANTNDVRTGVRQLAGDLRSYYEVIYAPSNLEWDGRFRRIQAKVNRKGVKVQTRSGYYATPPGDAVVTFPYELELVKALRVTPEPEDFPIRSSLFRFGPEEGGIRHTVVLEVPLEDIAFEPAGVGSDRAHFSLMVLLRDPAGQVAEKFSEDSPVALPSERRAAFKQGNAVFFRSFVLPKGRYNLETVVVDNLAKKRSVHRSAIEVADPPAQVALSDLTLVRRTESVVEGALPSRDPFRNGDTRIVPYLAEPHITSAESLTLFLVAYPHGSDPRSQLLVEYLRDGHLVGQSFLDLPEPGMDGRIPFVAAVPVETLKPGRYLVRVLFKQGPAIAQERAYFTLDGPDGAARTSSGPL